MTTLAEIHALEGSEYIDLMAAADLSIVHVVDLQRTSPVTP